MLRPAGPDCVSIISFLYFSKHVWSVELFTGCNVFQPEHFRRALTMAYASFSRQVHFTQAFLQLRPKKATCINIHPLHFTGTVSAPETIALFFTSVR